MFTEQLMQDVHALMTAGGAALFGFADVSVIPAGERHDLPIGIAFAMPLRPEIVVGLPAGPDHDYEAEYHRLNDGLTRLGEQCAVLLQRAGYRAVAQGATFSDLDKATLSVQLPHKTVATRAGWGWVGKCALLVTPSFGSAIRLNSVLTDAPFPVAAPSPPRNARRIARPAVPCAPPPRPPAPPGRPAYHGKTFTTRSPASARPNNSPAHKASRIPSAAAASPPAPGRGNTWRAPWRIARRRPQHETGGRLNLGEYRSGS